MSVDGVSGLTMSTGAAFLTEQQKMVLAQWQPEVEDADLAAAAAPSPENLNDVLSDSKVISGEVKNEGQLPELAQAPTSVWELRPEWRQVLDALDGDVKQGLAYVVHDVGTRYQDLIGGPPGTAPLGEGKEEGSRFPPIYMLITSTYLWELLMKVVQHIANSPGRSRRILPVDFVNAWQILGKFPDRPPELRREVEETNERLEGLLQRRSTTASTRGPETASLLDLPI